MLHQRTPEGHFLQPCKVGVEVVHAPPRRRKACHFVGSEKKTDPETVRFEDSLDVSEAEKTMVVAKKMQKGKGKDVRTPCTDSRDRGPGGTSSEDFPL